MIDKLWSMLIVIGRKSKMWQELVCHPEIKQPLSPAIKKCSLTFQRIIKEVSCINIMAELKEGFYVTLAEGAREFPGVRDGTKAKNQPIFRSLKWGLQYLCLSFSTTLWNLSNCSNPDFHSFILTTTLWLRSGGTKQKLKFCSLRTFLVSRGFQRCIGTWVSLCISG